MSDIITDKSEEVVQALAIILGKVSHHVHQDIVKKIVEENVKFKKDFEHFCEKGRELVSVFLYEGSDCIFPGVRRPINKEKMELGRKWKNTIYKKDYTIFNDNTYPRHIWSFLSDGKAYSGGKNGVWNKGLGKFELAHIFAHKTDERILEQKIF